MTASRTEREVAIWLTDLGKLTAGQAPLPDAKAKIATMAAALAAEFDARAFCRASLIHAARRCKFFPTFGEACEALSEWCRENPGQRQITAPDTEPNAAMRKLERERTEAEASWRNISEPQIFAKVRALDGHPKRTELGRILAVALKRHAPRMLGMLPPEFLAANDDRSAA